MRRAPSFRGIYFARPSGCINLQVIQPRFRETNSMMILARPGALLLDVAPALDAAAAGGAAAAAAAARGEGGAARRYDWQSKVSYRLSAGDIAYLASLPPASEAQLSKSTVTAAGGAPQVQTLSIAPDAGGGGGGRGGGGGGSGGGGASFRLTVGHSGEGVPSRSAAIWLSPVDLALLKHLANQSLSVITGWAVNLDPSLYDPACHALAAPGGGGGGGGEGM